MRLLLVDDEPVAARVIAAHGKAIGYTVDVVRTAEEAVGAAKVAPYAVVLLSRRLPDGDGLRLIPRLRHLRPGLPVIVISALSAVAERIAGLDAGADDYVGKPFHPDELMARVRAVLRRPPFALLPITVGALSFDLALRQALVADAPLYLRRRELSLLEALVRRVGRVVPRELLIAELFGFGDDVQSNTLDTHVSRLRGSLNRVGGGVVIEAVRGIGYRLGPA